MEKKSFPLFRRRTNADKPPQQQQQQQSSTSIPTSSSGGVVPSENGNGMSVLRSAVAATSISGTNNGNSNNIPAVAAAIAASSSRGRSTNASSSSSSSSGEFLVSIPPDVKPGENFQVMAGGRIFRVRCPMNSIPGQQVKIALPVVADKNTQDQKRASNEIGGGGGGRGAAGGGSSGNLEALSSSQTSDNSTSSIQQQQQLQHDNPNQTNNDNNNKKETKMFQVIVPRGVKPGSPFALMAGGVRVLVTCPSNATMGDKICFHLPLGLLNQPDGPKSHLAEIILKYDKNGWTRTIRATTDMKFIWTRLDEIGNVDQRTRFDTERSAYVRKMHYVREEDGRVRGWCTLVTPDRVAVDSYVENSEGEKIVTYRDIVSAQMMSYDDKVEWFHATCKQLATEGVILLTVRRDYLLGDSMKHLMSLNPMQLRKSWMIRFQDEPGLDAGGLMREWFELVTEELFTPSYGCWKNNSNNQWQIHPFSEILNENHLTFFRFAGRLMGRAIFMGQLVKGHMEKHVYKHVLGFPIMFNDLKDLDEEYFNSLKSIENCRNTTTAAEFESLFDFTFTVAEDATLLQDDVGPKVVKEVELVPGGAQLNVTHENIPEYIEARLKYHVMGRYEAQLNEILVGIYEVVPEALLTIFDFQELELLMCGLPEIDMDDWMANTVYEGVYKIPGSSHMVCRWFWEIVHEYDHELKARLLQFVTGTSGVPSKGFGYLTDHNGIRKFTILSVPYPFFKFPRSHTCFNRIDLPVYSTREELEKYLKIAITMAATGFDIE